MLTAKQKELLLLIQSRLAETGVPPSFEEMKEALDLKSKSGIHRLITALEERGFIRRLPHRARALEIVKLPDNMQPFGGQTRSADGGPPALRSGTSASVVSFNAPRVAEPAQRLISTVPMMGRIAAGVPIAAIQDHTKDVHVPPDMINSGEHFALEVKGDSMIDAGIHEGDTVVIRRTSTAENGAIVVALVDDEEATLKRLRRKGSTVALEAANPLYETRIFRADQVAIQGQLVGLLRRY